MKLINVQLSPENIRLLCELLASGITNDDCDQIESDDSDPAAVLREWREISEKFVIRAMRSGRAYEDAMDTHRFNEENAEILERLLAGMNATEVLHG